MLLKRLQPKPLEKPKRKPIRLRLDESVKLKYPPIEFWEPPLSLKVWRTVKVGATIILPEILTQIIPGGTLVGKVLKTVLARLGEGDTYAAIAAVLVWFGVDPDSSFTLIDAGVILAGILGVSIPQGFFSKKKG